MNVRRFIGVCSLICLGCCAQISRAQTFRYAAEPRAGAAGFTYAEAEPAPLMARAPAASPRVLPRAARRPARPLEAVVAERQSRVRSSGNFLRRVSATESIAQGQPLDPFGEELPAPGGEIVYQDGSQPDLSLQPQPMDGNQMGPEMGYDELGYGDEYYDDGCYPGMDCSADGYGATFYLRRWWRHVSCLARHGAYTENMQFYLGKQGFKGPVDLGVNGDFGFHGGGNWGMPLLERYGIGYQIGANYIGSDFAGWTGPLGHRRAQFFVTSGVFRRAVDGRGFQGGAVLDYLRDDFYIQMDLTQVRAEMSYLCYHHELGFWGAFQGNTDTNVGQIPGSAPQVFSYQANSQYNFFYRYEFCNGTSARTWAGMSGHGDGIFGGDATVRFSNKLGLMANYNYLLPRNDPTATNNVKESWNVTIAFVWYPGYKRCDSWTNPYRPLFYTADNGWFFTRQAN